MKVLRRLVTAACGVGIAGAMVFGSAVAHADADEHLQYQVCASLDAGLTAVNIAKVLVMHGYTIQEAADVVHDAVMDHCIGHYYDVWPAR